MATPLKVLIIEDSDSDVALDIKSLEDVGYKISHKVVTTAAEMKAALGKQTFDLIVSNHNLPQFNAPGALAVLKESGQDIPIIIVSGAIGEETVVELLKAGAHDYVMKNNLSRLGTAVQRELREVQVRREYRQAVNALRDSEQKYRSLVTQSPDGIFIANLKGNFLAVNRIMCENLKYSEKELLSMSIWDIVPESYINLHKKRLADILTGKAPNKAEEYSVRGKDGILHYVEILSAPYYEGTELIGFQGIARDIAERKKAEEELSESEERYRALFDRSNDLVYIHDFEGNFIEANSAALTLLGYLKKEITSLNFSSLLSQDQIPMAFKMLQEIRNTGMQKNSIEYHLKCKNGKYIYVDTRASIIYHNEKPYALLGIARDITERKQAEEELKHSYQKLKRTVDNSIVTIAATSETRDPYTTGHQKRVAKLACAVAEEMGFPQEKIEGIRVAGILHDIGKINVPSEILSKPGRLSELEMAFIKTHPQSGREILKTLELPWAICPAVLQHHERMDGSGYPSGLSGENITMEARILAVADVVEAMASHRPYRPALGIDKALEEIVKNKGKLYDPDVVDACLRLFKEKGFKFE